MKTAYLRTIYILAVYKYQLTQTVRKLNTFYGTLDVNTLENVFLHTGATLVGPFYGNENTPTNCGPVTWTLIEKATPLRYTQTFCFWQKDSILATVLFLAWVEHLQYAYKMKVPSNTNHPLKLSFFLEDQELVFAKQNFDLDTRELFVHQYLIFLALCQNNHNNKLTLSIELTPACQDDIIFCLANKSIYFDLIYHV